MQLPLAVRLKLFRQRLFAALGLRGAVPVSIEDSSEGVFVLVEGRRIAVPSPLRWKLYRQGWTARLDQLEREYGVGRVFQLSPSSIVLDVGANVGEFAHVAARYQSRIYCVEPDPAAHDCLRRNVAGLHGASVHDDLIWKENGAQSFGLAPDRADSSVFAVGARQISKRAVTVASFCAEHGVPRVDLLKCDAEGAEPEVLEGVGAFFPHLHGVALDTGPERAGARTNEACVAILRKQGFKVTEDKVGSRLMTYGVNEAAAP